MVGALPVWVYWAARDARLSRKWLKHAQHLSSACSGMAGITHLASFLGMPRFQSSFANSPCTSAAMAPDDVKPKWSKKNFISMNCRQRPHTLKHDMRSTVHTLVLTTTAGRSLIRSPPHQSHSPLPEGQLKAGLPMQGMLWICPVCTCGSMNASLLNWRPCVNTYMIWLNCMIHSGRLAALKGTSGAIVSCCKGSSVHKVWGRTGEEHDERALEGVVPELGDAAHEAGEDAGQDAEEE